MRRLVLLLALGGCDLVFGLERNPDPPVCGPFRAPEEVPLVGLDGAHDFSVDSTGTVGMVHVNVGAWTGPHAIKKDANGMWVRDMPRDMPQLDRLTGAHMMANGTAFGWIDRPSGPMLNQYTFASTKWNLVAGEVVESSADRDAHAGNEIELPIGTNVVQKFLVELRPPIDDGFTDLRILQRTPASTFWQVTGQAEPLRSAKPTINPNGGVLTADHEILVYSAQIGNQNEYRLFASRRTRDEFPIGVELIIENTPSATDFSEPWINADCTTLYFRQAETTWMTTALDDAASRR